MATHSHAFKAHVERRFRQRIAPHAVVISKRLRNVIPNRIRGWDKRWMLAYHPETRYFEETAEVP